MIETFAPYYSCEVRVILGKEVDKLWLWFASQSGEAMKGPDRSLVERALGVLRQSGCIDFLTSTQEGWVSGQRTTPLQGLGRRLPAFAVLDDAWTYSWSLEP
ncbi:hypothetical protein [Verrucomicrobium sp. BvORR106]|uniref:hypothetical protein n=1 Tax=Verrucomicrobium sp. BvORR106 TaxID=1403819 RepID=UPI00056F6575|nr:hypothetical protein [Verrucomicrobium sp. BvORR106]